VGLEFVRRFLFPSTYLLHTRSAPYACNKHGEGVLHLACRRGLRDAVHYFVREKGVTLRVRDDYGRTPLHDACWTNDPDFELIRFIVAREPDLFRIADARGFTPLAYAPKEHWQDWYRFLDDNQDIVCNTSY